MWFYFHDFDTKDKILNKKNRNYFKGYLFQPTSPFSLKIISGGFNK
jgi:hypothetical protein